VLRNLMHEKDQKLAVLACKIGLLSAPEAEKRDVILRLLAFCRARITKLSRWCNRAIIRHTFRRQRSDPLAVCQYSAQ
jgi:hypothetical protein